MSMSCAFAPHLCLGNSRIIVIDQALSGRLPKLRGRIAPLIGDAGWLWHEHLIAETSISGLTRPADAFVFARLALDVGMRATHCLIDSEAVSWTLERPAAISLE
jgi:hypothetical protein